MKYLSTYLSPWSQNGEFQVFKILNMSYSKLICLSKENEFGKLLIVTCSSRQTSILFPFVRVNFVAVSGDFPDL